MLPFAKIQFFLDTLQGDSNWSVTSFLTNAGQYLQNVGSMFLVVLGIILIIAAGFFTFRKLTSENSRDSWFKILGMAIFGGALAVGGFSFIARIASGGKTTIEDLGGGQMIIPMLKSLF